MNQAYKSAFNSAFKKAKKLITNPSRIASLLTTVVSKSQIDKKTVNQIKGELLLLVDLVKSWKNNEYKDVSTSTILSVVAALIYFVNPFDLIPDFTPIIGFTDDVTILFYVVNKISTELDRYRNWKELQTINKIGKDF